MIYSFIQTNLSVQSVLCFQRIKEAIYLRRIVSFECTYLLILSLNPSR